VLVAAVVATAVVYSPFLDVDRIDIIGSTKLTPAQLAARTGVKIGSPMVFVDPGRLADELRRDPHFLRVAVTRQFPSRVSIRLTDRQPLARVAGPKLGVIVGEGGIVMDVARGDEFLRTINVDRDPTTKPGARLPEHLAAAVDVAGSMGLELAVKIRSITITPSGELVFELTSGGKVLFGTTDDADRKLSATRTMLGSQVDTRGVCQLDVRVPSAPTMRRNPDCASSTQP
jgi:cell division protein FtsQ